MMDEIIQFRMVIMMPDDLYIIRERFVSVVIDKMGLEDEIEYISASP